LFQVLKTPEDWVELWVEKIKSYVKSIGFFNNKAKNIYATCKLLTENWWKIPKTIEELVKFPGVWIKTSKVFLAVVEDAPYIGVDTHVHRVLNRLWLVHTKSPLETDKVISKWFTKTDHARLHHTLVLFWRYYCTARKPKCENCVFKEKCDETKKL
jgi:endonuclease-3